MHATVDGTCKLWMVGGVDALETCDPGVCSWHCEHVSLFMFKRACKRTRVLCMHVMHVRMRMPKVYVRVLLT